MVAECIRKGLIDRDTIDKRSCVYIVLVPPDRLGDHLRNGAAAPFHPKRSAAGERRRKTRKPPRADQPLLSFEDAPDARDLESAGQRCPPTGRTTLSDRGRTALSCQPAEYPYEDELRKQQHPESADADVVVVDPKPDNSAIATAFAALKRAGIFARAAASLSQSKPPDLVQTVIAYWSSKNLPPKVLQGKIVNTLNDPAGDEFWRDSEGYWRPPRDATEAPAEDIHRRIERQRLANKRIMEP